ncbi:MAG TPA: glycosyltransferase family 2 protein [Thermoplasmata archaeon]|nr:glycosyltransferase family 2 protein [Thermoplasmata archaeon]
MRATLIVPTLNEAESIGHVLKSFRAAADAANPSLFRSDPLVWEVIVVDGASTDGTAQIAEAAGARVIVESRKGYGRAYRTGFASATGEIVATLDGDATYPVAAVGVLVRKLLDEQLDFVSGDRLSELDPKAMTTEHRLGNWVLNTFLRIAYAHYLVGVTGRMIRDSQSGMWVFRRSILSTLKLSQDGMPLSEEIKIEAILRGFRFAEVPIHYAERWGAPKLSSWRDGRQNLLFLFRKRFEVARLRARGEIAKPQPAPRA